MIRHVILADLAQRYPDGYLALAISGKRLAEPELQRCTIGWRTKINGEFHLYDHVGRFISSGYANLLYRSRLAAARAGLSRVSAAETAAEVVGAAWIEHATTPV